MIYSVIPIPEIYQLQRNRKVLHAKLFQHLRHIALLVGSGIIRLLNGTPQTLGNHIVKMLVAAPQDA